MVADTGRVLLRAGYLVAADGGEGRTHDDLGIGRSGPGTFGHGLRVLVEADLGTRMEERQSAISWLRQPLPGSLFIAVDNKTRWLFVVPSEPDAEPGEPLTEHRCMDLVRGGLGDDSVELHYLGHRVWQPTALVADGYHSGRVFLAGDAAHVTTPEGGLGVNCGVADAHDLAWKLAGVLAGWASPRLLDSSEKSGAHTRSPRRGECRPRATAQPHRRTRTRARLRISRDHERPHRPADHPRPGRRVPAAGRPGHRAPHLWLEDGRSILDLFGHAFVALTDPAGKQSLDAAAASVPAPPGFQSPSGPSTPPRSTTSAESNRARRTRAPGRIRSLAQHRLASSSRRLANAMQIAAGHRPHNRTP